MLRLTQRAGKILNQLKSFLNSIPSVPKGNWATDDNWKIIPVEKVFTLEITKSGFLRKKTKLSKWTKEKSEKS